MPRFDVTSLPDPELMAVANRAFKVLALAADKVVANSIAPQRYPITRGSLEDILKNRFREVLTYRGQSSVERTAAIADKARRTTNAQRMWRQRYSRTMRAQTRDFYGPLADINLAARTSVAAQLPPNYFFGQSRPTVQKLDVLQRTASREWPRDIQSWVGGMLPFVPGAGTTPAPANTKLQFLVKQVHCVDETTGFLGTESGADEISLGGLKVNPRGDTHRISQSRVASFEQDGATKNYDPPLVFAEFNLNDPNWWPKYCFVTMALAEIDMGGFGVFLSDLVDLVKARIAAELATTVGLAVAALAPVVGLILLAVVFVAVLLFFAWLKTTWEDDVFDPVTTVFGLESAAQATFDGVAEDAWAVANFIGHGGHYQIRYTWRCCQ